MRWVHGLIVELYWEPSWLEALPVRLIAVADRNLIAGGYRRHSVYDGSKVSHSKPRPPDPNVS